MPIARFKSYTPGDKPYARRRTDEEWDHHRQMLSEMHAQRYTRREMLAKLKHSGFEVSPGQLLSQMKKWNMMVYGERASQAGLPLQPPQGPTGAITIDEAVSDELTLTPDFTSPPPERDSTEDLQYRSISQPLYDAVGGRSLSSVDEAREASGTEYQEYDDTISLGTPPPTYTPEASADETTFVNAFINALEPEMADSSAILRQVETITEPWCGNFPTVCCCRAFFFGEDRFSTSPKLYEIVLDQSCPQSLAYIMALLNLAATRPTGQTRAKVRRHLETAVENYLRICTRVEYKNKLAPHILHRLIRVWEDFADGDHLALPASNFLRYDTARTNGALLKKIFKTKPTILSKAKSSGCPVNWQTDSERDVGCLVGFTARRPSTFPLLNSDGEIFGSTKSWSTLGTSSLAELVPTAQQLAAYMQSQWSNGITIHSAYDLSDCNIPLIFMGIGLMIALEASSSAQGLIEPQSGTTAHGAWTPGIRAFIEATVNTLSLNADHADKFRKAYWLVRCAKIGHHGKTIHMGGERCTASLDWETLSRPILSYDEERSWIERRLFSGQGNTWPQLDDLLVTTTPTALDAASVRSTSSSIGSFRRFQALALHLKIGVHASSSLSSRSAKSKSTRSGMSTESHLSWQLEQMLDIRNEDDERSAGKDEVEAEIGSHVACIDDERDPTLHDPRGDDVIPMTNNA